MKVPINNNWSSEGKVLLSFFKSKKKLNNNGLVGVHVSVSGISVAHIQSNGPSLPSLKACKYFPCPEIAGRGAVLANAIDDMGLKQLPVNYVLTPPAYSLLLVEQPQVPAEEMKQAVRWRIKDLVDFNVDTAAVDVITLPEDAFRGRTQMLYVVAAPRKTISEVEQLFSEIDLRLQSIDIAELTLGNLMDSSDTGAKSIAMMHFEDDQGVLNLVKDHTLYLTRNIKANVAQMSGDLIQSQPFNHLLLETQRSLDYYESQLGQPPATQLFVTSLAENSQLIEEGLNTNLGLKVEHIAVNEAVEGAENLSPELLQQCALAIAGALRRVAV